MLTAPQVVVLGGNDDPASLQGALGSLQSQVSPIVNGMSFAQGRLTLASGLPVMNSSFSAAGTVYYTPYLGNVVCLPVSGASNFNEMSQALTDATKSPAAAANSSLYDMFVWLDSSGPGSPIMRCTRGPAWSSSISRGSGAGTTQLQFANGSYQNAFAITNGPAAGMGLYVGTIATDASAKVNWIFGSAAAGGGAAIHSVWNMYNRVQVSSLVCDTTGSWTTTNTSREPTNNGALSLPLTATRVTFVFGLSEDPVDLSWYARTSNGGSSYGYNDIGLDSISSGSANSIVTSSVINVATSGFSGAWSGFVGLGQHYLQMLQAVSAAFSATWFGGGPPSNHGIKYVTRM